MKLILKNLFTDGKLYLIDTHTYNLAFLFNNIEDKTIIQELKLKQVKSNRKIILEDEKVLYISNNYIVVGDKDISGPIFNFYKLKDFICVTDKDEAITIAKEKLEYSRIVQ